MKNGKTKILTERQKSQLLSEWNKTRVKQDLVFKYKLNVNTIERAMTSGKCSQRIYDVLFRNQTIKN